MSGGSFGYLYGQDDPLETCPDEWARMRAVILTRRDQLARHGHREDAEVLTAMLARMDAVAVARAEYQKQLRLLDAPVHPRRRATVRSVMQAIEWNASHDIGEAELIDSFRR